MRFILSLLIILYGNSVYCQDLKDNYSTMTNQIA